MLKKTFLEQHEDGVVFYIVESDNVKKCVLQVETNVLYDSVCITDTDPYTYREIDIPKDS